MNVATSDSRLSLTSTRFSQQQQLWLKDIFAPILFDGIDAVAFYSPVESEPNLFQKHTVFAVADFNDSFPLDTRAEELLPVGQVTSLPNDTGIAVIVSAGSHILPNDHLRLVEGIGFILSQYIPAEIGFRDHLTGALDRSALDALFHTHSSSDLALAMCDLDNFKTINDSYGHETGDAVLKAFVDTANLFLTDEMAIARTGGDEFVILAWGNKFDTLIDCVTTIKRHFESVVLVDMFAGSSRTVGVSIGVADNDQVDSTDLWSAADDAAYAAKGQSNSAAVGYMSADSVITARTARRTIASRISRFLNGENVGGQIALFGQPIVSTPDLSGVVSVEVLARWVDEDANIVSPALFIPALEEFGISSAFDLWMLTEVIKTLANSPDHFRLNVNASPRFVLTGGIETVTEQLLKRHNVDPSRLTIEIVEQALIEDPVRLAEASEALNALGVTVSLDDFGGGYSNLSSVRDGSVQQIKIDGQWITSVCDDELSQHIVRSVIGAAKIMGQTTVAEQVETIEQYNKVKELGVDSVQGYMVARPEPIQVWIAEAEASTPASNVIPLRPQVADAA